MKLRVILVLFPCFIMVSGCWCGPVSSPKELVVDTFLSPSFVIEEDILSTEPIIFVRSFNLSAEGAKDLDQTLEKKLAAVKHRMSSRSVGAKIKLIAQLIYLGKAADLSVDKILSSGFAEELVKDPTPSGNSNSYAFIAIVDIEVITVDGLKQDSQKSRVVAVARNPMPEMSSEGVRAALLDKVASQISAVFEF